MELSQSSECLQDSDSKGGQGLPTNKRVQAAAGCPAQPFQGVAPRPAVWGHSGACWACSDPLGLALSFGKLSPRGMAPRGLGAPPVCLPGSPGEKNKMGLHRSRGTEWAGPDSTSRLSGSEGLEPTAGASVLCLPQHKQVPHPVLCAPTWRVSEDQGCAFPRTCARL